MGLSLRSIGKRLDDIFDLGVRQVQGVVAQANPLDDDRTYKTVMNKGASYAPSKPQSVFHQATHNPVSNIIGDVIKAPAQFSMGAGSNIYNRVVAPVFKLPEVKLSETPLASAARYTGADDSLHRTVGSGLETALLLGTGGASRLLQAGASKVIPKAAPAVVNRIAPKVVDAAGQSAAYGAASGAANNMTPEEILKTTAISGVAGAAFPVAGAVAAKGGKAAVRATRRAAPKVTQAVKAADEKMFTTPKMRLGPDAKAMISDWADYKMGRYKAPAADVIKLDSHARKMSAQTGIDFINGSPQDIDRRVAQLLDRRAVTQGGYARIPANKNIGYSRVVKPKQKQPTKLSTKSQQEATNFSPQPSLATRGSNKVPLEVTNKDTIRGEFQRAITDKEASIIRYLKDTEKRTGQKGLVDQFYYNSGLQRRANSIANAKLEKSKELQSALKGLTGKSKQEFDQYAAARNELSNAKRGLPTAASQEELQVIVAQLGPKYEKRFTELNKFYKGWAKDQYDAGLIDEETYKRFTSNNDYSRIQRDMEDLAKPPTRGGNSYSLGTTSARQKRKGSQRAIQPADVTAFNYAQEVQKEIQRNQTASDLIDALLTNGHARKVSDTTRKNTLSRIVNGKTEIYEVPRDIKEVADNITPYQLGLLGRIVSAPQRLLRAGATGLSMPFTIANYLKDQAGSAVFSKDVLTTHNPVNIYWGLHQAAKDFGVGSDDKLWQKFIAHAGDTTQYDFIRNVKNAKQFSREVRLGQGGRVINKGINPIRTLEDLNQITEKATRFQNFKGVYNKALKETGSEAEATRRATLAAWQNSVDFSRMGHVSQALNLLIPYFNASVQGTRLLARRFSEDPVATSAKTVGVVGLPLAAITLYNTVDPERKKVYDNISDYEKENNIVFVMPGAEQKKDGSYTGVFKIPLQPGLSNLVQPLRHTAESFNNSNKADAAKMTQEFFGALTGPVNIKNFEAAAGGLIPQAVKPAVQQVANKDLFTGRDIVPDYIEQATDASGKPVSEEKKAYDYTSGSAQMLGRLLNISPIRVEKFIKDTSGKVGQYSENAVDNLLAKAGVIPEDQIGGVSVVEDIARRFTRAQGDVNYKASEGAKYFDRVAKAVEKLNPNEQAAFRSLHPNRKNFLGDVITDASSVYNPAARLDIYNRYPKVFAADRNLDRQNRKEGKPGNPLFDLQDWQVKKVLEKDNLPPGSKDPELSNLYKQPWYQDYQTKRSSFFDAIDKVTKGKLTKNNDNPYPVTPPELQRVMDYYSTLPRGTGARSAWIKSNPGAWRMMQEQFAKVDNWQNNRRLARGLDTTEGAAGEAAGYASDSSNFYGDGSKNVGSIYRYNISRNTGGNIARPKVSAKTSKIAKAKSKKGTTKAKVSIKKSLV